MQDIAPEVVSIAEACLGGLQGRSALLIGPDEQLLSYSQLLRRAKMKYIYQEDTSTQVPYLLPHVQLLIIMPATPGEMPDRPPLFLTAASIAKGCENRRTPLLIFDLALSTSVDELAGLLPAVCLYTPDDLRRILLHTTMKAS